MVSDKKGKKGEEFTSNLLAKIQEYVFTETTAIVTKKALWNKQLIEY